MEKKKRSVNVLFNSLFGVLATIVSTLMTFAVRKALSYSLGEEVYGLNTLFASVITTLLIMELGISTAMTFYLYKPIAEEDNERIKSIIRLYRNVYRVFCTILFGCGLIVGWLFLPYMVTSSLSMNTVREYFFIFLVSIVIKYLWSYKRSILFASQQNRVCTGVTAGCELFLGVLEIFVLIHMRNYFLYLVLLVLQNTASNCICNWIVNKKYAYIKEKEVQPISKEDKKKIVKTIKPLFIQRIAGVIQDSSITVILSVMSDSIATVGFYGNYQLVLHTAQALYSQIGAAFTTSFGNFSAQENRENCYRVYKKSRFLMNWLSALIAICFMLLIQMFIELFFGANYVLNIKTVLILTVYLYGYLNNVILVSIQNALGLHAIDAKQMVYQAFLNIVLSICGGVLWGLEGILLGMLVSTFIFSTVYKGMAIYKHLFKKSRAEYVKMLINEYIRFVLCGVLSYIVMGFFLNENTLLIWLIRALVSCVLVNVLFCVLSIKNSDFEVIKGIVRNLVKNRRRC